jgi:peptide/nickel transport system substrate-binding protein
VGVPRDPGLPPGGPRPESDIGSNVPTGTDVHAFLIADVRGWTSFTQARGDEESGRLAARFAEVAREVIKEHQGEVLELRGDEALCVFGSPRSAIRAAVALQQRFVEETIADPSLPLTVGIGLDAGEAVPVEGGYRGGALNVAARLCSRARAGEVLASREIVHLARRIDGIRFTERGQADMKGLDQPVHVVAVRAEAADTVEAIAPFVRSTAHAPAPHRRRNTVAGLVAFLLVVALVAIPLARRSGGSSVIAPNSIGVLDADSGEVVSTLGLTTRPGSIAASADGVWVTNPDAETVTRIEPEGQDVHDAIHVGQNPTGIAVGEDVVWVVESGGPSVSRISPDTNAVVGDAIGVGNGPAGIAVGEGAVWVTNRFDGTISRIDPNRGKVVKTIPVGLDPRGITTGFGSVWVGLAGSNTVIRIDADTNKLTKPIGVGNAPGSLAVSADAVWVVNTLDDTVSEISPDTNSVVDTVQVGDQPSDIAVVDGIVWVANAADGMLSRIEPGETLDQTSVRTVVIGSVPQGLAGVNGDVWVSVRGTATSHLGGTIRLVSELLPISIDSTLTYDPPAYRVLHLLGDGLVAFEPVGGTNPALVPDLATSLPTLSPDGRTYTFQLRPGIRYSNGEFVAPDDFRSALERGFRLDYNGAHPYLYGELKGAEACVTKPQTCDLSRGIVSDEATGTITFNLVEPDPEFLYKLTMPFAFPVPPSVSEKMGERAKSGIPGTGPYMLDGPMTRKGLTLVRNPQFDVWSAQAQPDGNVDRIEWRFGLAPDAQVRAVRAGDADVALDAGQSSRLDEILVRFAARVHASLSPVTGYFKFGTEAPPFDRLEVRKALNLALDRDRFVQILGGESAAVPTCQQLPPNFPGYEPYCPYTADPAPGGGGPWTAPNMKEAQKLVDRSGTARTKVVLEYSIGAPRDVVDYMLELLDDLGYRGSASFVPLKRFVSPDNEFQMAATGWGADYPAASSFMNLLRCDAPSLSGGFCSPRIDDMVDRATDLQLEDPAAAGALWAEIDRAFVDLAPALWAYNLISVEFVAESVGNYQWSPQWGSELLNQIWVQ